MRIDISIVLKSLPFRLFILLIGVGLALLCVAMLFPVAVNLPESWFGLIDMTIGLMVGLCCIAYFFRQKNILLIPILLFSITASLYLTFPTK
jgi:uncharacterized membrane protein YgaE (UPF0421/DUF939 family)